MDSPSTNKQEKEALAQAELVDALPLVKAAFILSLLLLLFDLAVIVVAFLAFTLSPLQSAFLLALLPYAIIFGLAGNLILVYIVVRIYSLQFAIETGDVRVARGINTFWFGILVVLFGGVAPGILLLVAHTHTEKAARLVSVVSVVVPAASEVSPPSPNSTPSLDCPQCGQAAEFHAVYQKYWCNRCEKYC